MEAHHALATRFDSYSIRRQLHDVPPHEVFEVTVDGRRAVFKRDTGPTGTAGVEGRVTAFVGDETSVPVPEILAAGDDWYLAAWHPDAPEPDVGGDPDESWARAAGRGLATLHAETAEHVDSFGRFRPGGNGDGVRVEGGDDWREAAMAYVRRRRPVLDDHGHADVADAVLEYLREHPGALSGASDPVCCHGWWTPEHVPVADREVACVVDFEHALAAPAEYDYWRTVVPTFDGGTALDDGAALDTFREGYESVRALPDGVDARRPLYLALLGVYYVESLYVQDQHDQAATEQRASAFRELVFGALDDC